MAAGVNLPDEVRYNRDIRPIFSSTCFNCHGPDKAESKGDLQIHTFDLATSPRPYQNKNGQSKVKPPVIVPFKPQESEVWRRIDDRDDDVMPPEDFHLALTATEKLLIEKWILQGAKYESHWAYQPIPVFSYALRPEQWIDRSINAAIKAKQLPRPLTRADKSILIRRLSLDLRGHIPSNEEIESFVNNSSTTAWENLVDLFLASKSYGERMAVHWLDLVRYADTVGYYADEPVDVYPYRDYVIDAFNVNKPFDLFTREQIAGDLIASNTVAQKVASAYNRLSMMTSETGVNEEEYIAKYTTDRVKNVSAVWLGSTLACAECHDHKYDPFKARDFYRMGAFFADIHQRGDYRKDGGNPIMFRPYFELPSSSQWALGGDRDSSALPTLLDVTDAKSSHGTILTAQEDGSFLASGPMPANETYAFSGTSSVRRITGFQLEALTHASLVKPMGGLSRGNGNFVLTYVEVRVQHPGQDAVPVKMASAVADFSQNGLSIRGSLSADANTGWAVYPTPLGQKRTAIFYPETPVETHPETVITIRLVHGSQYAQHVIGRPRLSVFSDASPALPAADTSKKVIIVSTVAVEPRVSRVFPRGNWQDTSGEIVMPGVPMVFAQIPTSERASRLELAQWLCSEDNPLAARSFVNRMWIMFFGNGLTNTPEDLGSQGEYPINLELLDFLSRYFVESGWDMKKLIRTIVLTEAYRRDSALTVKTKDLDPANRYLTRQSIVRLPAEVIRDNGLIVSDLLNKQVGGPSVFPYQPAGYWSGLSHPVRVYRSSTGPQQYRKGLYTYWQRTFLHPFFKNFDAPSREEATCRRVVSNTPIQALNLLNDRTFLEISGHFAMRISEQPFPTTESAVTWAFNQALGRKPTTDEISTLSHLYSTQLITYQNTPQPLIELRTSVGLTGKELSPTDGAWISVARALLNLHEYIVRR